MIGIYKITNNINGKCYIGQSFDVERRLTSHKSTAFNKNSPSYSYPLYQSIRKHGVLNFSFEVLQECGIDELNEMEIYYINKFNSVVPNGYNQDYGGNNAPHYTKLSDELVTQIIQKLKTSKEKSDVIGAEFGVCGSLIRKINVGATSYRENESYPIREKETQTHVCDNCGAIISSSAKKCVFCSHLEQRKTNRPSAIELAGLVQKLGFREVAKMFGVSDKAIVKWCKSYNIPHKRKELSSWYNKQIGICDIPQESNNIKPKRRIAQIDLTTNQIVSTFDSTNEAAHFLGKNKGSHIAEVCNGIHQQAYGYKWKYIT